MNKVVIVNQSAGYLTLDVVNAFAHSYSDVVLISGSNGPKDYSFYGQVKCDYIVKYNKKNAFSRLLSWIIGTVQVLWKLLLKYKDYEIVFFTNPPFCVFIVPFLPGRVYTIVVYDLYPDALKNIGVRENSIIYRLWNKVNIKAFAGAVKLITLSDGMKSALSKYVESCKIKVVYNWPSSGITEPICKENNIFLKKYGLEDKFVILYSGNMGYTHDLECIVEVADSVKDDKSFAFVFIGEGKKKDVLSSLVKQKKLDNCYFLSWQPADMLSHSLCAADVGIVTINQESSLVSVPSKTYNLLAAGVPLLCIASSESELARLVLKFNNGNFFEKKNIDGMVRYIKHLKEDEVYYHELSNNSLMAAKNFTKSNAEQYV